MVPRLTKSFVFQLQGRTPFSAFRCDLSGREKHLTTATSSDCPQCVICYEVGNILLHMSSDAFSSENDSAEEALHQAMRHPRPILFQRRRCRGKNQPGPPDPELFRCSLLLCQRKN